MTHRQGPFLFWCAINRHAQRMVYRACRRFNSRAIARRPRPFALSILISFDLNGTPVNQDGQPSWTAYGEAPSPRSPEQSAKPKPQSFQPLVGSLLVCWSGLVRHLDGADSLCDSANAAGPWHSSECTSLVRSLSSMPIGSKGFIGQCCGI